LDLKIFLTTGIINTYVSDIRTLFSLLFISEVSRNPASLINNLVFLELWESGNFDDKPFVHYPMSPKKSVEFIEIYMQLYILIIYILMKISLCIYSQL
jgi:hypothetical protein